MVRASPYGSIWRKECSEQRDKAGPVRGAVCLQHLENERIIDETIKKEKQNNQGLVDCFEDFLFTLHEIGLSEQRSDKTDFHCNTIPFTVM